MKKGIIDTIIKANHVFFFIASCIFIVIAAMTLIKEFNDYSYEPPQVKVVKPNTDNGSANKINYSLKYVTLLKDTHIFKIKSNKIKVSNEYQESDEMLSMFNGGSSYSESTINFLFVDQENNSTKLFPNDFFLQKYQLSDFEYKSQYISEYGDQFFISKNIYILVTADTNKDGFLSDDDVKNLYFSDYNGKNSKLIIKNIEDYQVIANDLLMIKQIIDEEQLFTTFNLKTYELKKLETKF